MKKDSKITWLVLAAFLLFGILRYGISHAEVRFASGSVGSQTCETAAQLYDVDPLPYEAYMAGWQAASDVFLKRGKPATFSSPESLARWAIRVCRGEKRSGYKFATIVAWVHQEAVKQDQ